MARNDDTAAVIDTLLRITADTTALGIAFAMPNAIIALDKPLSALHKQLDKRSREREARRLIYYAKQQGLFHGDYEHGLELTDKAKKRLSRLEIDELTVPEQEIWDHKWRLVFYDIPESHKTGRNALTYKLRQLNFYQLQRSVWIHPLPCKEIIAELTSRYDIAKFVSYIETDHIDNDQALLPRFTAKIPNTKF